MNNKLYESIINDIAKIVKTELNEMSKNISFRNIDRNVWLSVASTISKNKETEAEFIKPMKKLTLNDLLQRYIAALLITKKPCPKTKKDIETLKTYKLYAQKALELGATISDIKNLYNQNNNTISAAKAKQNTIKETKPVQNAQQPITKEPVKRKSRTDKYIDILEGFIQNLPERMWNSIPDYYYGLEDNQCFKACQPQLETYLKSIIRKSHNSFEKFGELIQKDCNQFSKIFGETPKYYIRINKTIGYVYSTYNSYSKSFIMTINDKEIDMHIEKESNSFSNKNVYKESYSDNNLFKNLASYDVNTYAKEKKSIKLLLEFEISLFKYIIRSYIKYKKENRYNLNKQNIKDILKKYNMSETGKGTWSWAQKNIYNILYNNPDVKIYINYGDWQGKLDSIYYDSNTKKYFVNCYCQGDSTDWDSADYLTNLLRSTRNYSFDSGYQDCRCYVSDMEAAYEKMYAEILKLIKDGKLN